jgi:colicin import membrane protein
MQQSSRGKPQDTSALFSLQELMRLEAERELEERRKADERAAAEQRAREAEEAKRQDDERLRIAKEEERKLEAVRRDREEKARLDAIREAEQERARAEAEHTARMQTLRLQQEHEHALAALGRDTSKRRAKWLAAISVVVCIAVVVIGVFVVRAQMRKTAELEGQIAGLQSEIDEKQRQIATTTSPEDRKKLEDQLADLQHRVDTLSAGKNPQPQQHIATPPANRTGVPKKDDPCEAIRNSPNDPRRFDPANPCL